MSNTMKPLLYGVIGGVTVLAGSILYNKFSDKKTKQGSAKSDVLDDSDKLDFNIFDTHQGDFDPEDASDFFSESSNHQSNPDIDMKALQQMRNDFFTSGYNAGKAEAAQEYSRGYTEGVKYGFSIAQANAAQKIDDAYEEGKLDGLNANAPDLSGIDCEPPLELDDVIKSGAIDHVYKPDEKSDSNSEETKEIASTPAAVVVEESKKKGEDPIVADNRASNKTKK